MKPAVKPVTKVDVCREWRRKYPDKPTLALSKMIYEKEKPLFKDVEEIRERLRYIEGKKGKLWLSKLGKKTEFVLQEHRPRNPTYSKVINELLYFQTYTFPTTT